MTREEILAMKPGRELDGLVENHVFKIPFVEDETNNYSTDISAAWEVVEKLQNKFNWFIKKDCQYQWYYSSFAREQERLHYLCSGKSITEAICKAALWAVME